MATVHRILALALLAAGCSSLSVDSDYDPQVDFSSLHTFGWWSDTAPEGIDDLTAERIRAALAATLPEHGLQPAPAGTTPDVLVAYRASVRQRLEARPTTVSIGYGWHHGYGAIGTGTEVTTYDEGTLVVDLVSPEGGTLLWRGTASRAVPNDRTPEEREARIREAVRAILERYPPKG